MATRKLHYAWIIAGVTFLTLLVSAGIRAVPGVFVVPLETEFGWSRATISLAVGVNICLYGLMAPFSAAIMDRFGIRRTIVTALLTIGSGVALTTLMTQSWQLVVLWGVMVGDEHRLHRQRARGHRVVALVRDAPRRGAGHADVVGRRRPAAVPAAARDRHRELRLARRWRWSWPASCSGWCRWWRS